MPLPALLQNSDVHVRFHVNRQPFWNIYRSTEMLAKNPDIHQFLDPSPADIFHGNEGYSVRGIKDELGHVVWNVYNNRTKEKIEKEYRTEAEARQELKMIAQTLLRRSYVTLETLNNMNVHNKQLNLEQREAIYHITNGMHGRCPYIIFGPPGTGKTVTVIEAILQVLNKHENAKLLCITPSDGSADLLVQRLARHQNTNEMVRINAMFRHTSVPYDVLKYCKKDNGLDLYTIPDAKSLEQFQIVVTTSNTAAELYNVKLSSDHFTHIFVDEASQALESELYCALSLAGKETKVILAGDHRQLGPMYHSKLKRYGHCTRSLLERCMSLKMYKDEKPSYLFSVNT
eukprot:UN31280